MKLIQSAILDNIWHNYYYPIARCTEKTGIWRTSISWKDSLKPCNKTGEIASGTPVHAQVS